MSVRTGGDAVGSSVEVVLVSWPRSSVVVAGQGRGEGREPRAPGCRPSRRTLCSRRTEASARKHSRTRATIFQELDRLKCTYQEGRDDGPGLGLLTVCAGAEAAEAAIWVGSSATGSTVARFGWVRLAESEPVASHARDLSRGSYRALISMSSACPVLSNRMVHRTRGKSSRPNVMTQPRISSLLDPRRPRVLAPVARWHVRVCNK